MQHAVAVDAVVFVHGTARGGERTGNVALLAQDVVHLEADRGVAVEECLRNLGVPYELVPVHAGVAVAASALVGNVGSNLAGVSYTVRPTLYLSSSVKITSGTGTSSDPYELSM